MRPYDLYLHSKETLTNVRCQRNSLKNHLEKITTEYAEEGWEEHKKSKNLPIKNMLTLIN